MFKNFYNNLNSLENQYLVHNSLLHVRSNCQGAITPENISHNLQLILNALFNALLRILFSQ